MARSSLPPGILAELRQRQLLASGDTVEPFARGGEAVCFLMRRCPAREPLVVKLYRSSPDEVRRRARDEFVKLQKLSQRLDQVPELEAPRPIAVVEAGEHIAQVMAYVPAGSFVQQFLQLRPQFDDHGRIASALVQGLCLYHAIMGECYGETGPGNIMLSPEGVIVFIDPGFPNEHIRRVREEESQCSDLRATSDRMLASDITSWFAATSWWMARRPWRLRHLRRVAALMKAVLHIAAHCAEEGDKLAHDVARNSRRRYGRGLAGFRRPWHVAMRWIAIAILLLTRHAWMPSKGESSRSDAHAHR
jgi:hypothetical protein